MIKEDKNKKALKAIQDLIIEAGTMAYKNVSSKDLAEFLDDLEYLPALIIEGDNTELFENYLKEFCSKRNCIHVLNRYKMR